MLNRPQQYFLLTFFALAGSIATVQMINGQALYADGVRWFMDLRSGFDHPDRHLWRFSTYIYQYFIVATSDLFEGSTRLNVLYWLFNFCYLFHPVASLFISWAVLEEKKKFYIFFQLLSHFTIVLPALIYPCNHAVEVISYFWPLFFISIKRTWLKRDYPIFIIFCILLACSYSQAILLFPVLFLALFFSTFYQKNSFLWWRTLPVLAGVLFILVKFFYLLPESDKARGLSEVVLQFKERNMLVYAPFIAICWLILVYGKWSDRRIKSVQHFSLVLAIIISGWSLYFALASEDLATSNISGFRFVIIPFLAILSFLILILDHKKKLYAPSINQLLVLMFISLSPIIFNISMSYQWSQGLKNITQQTSLKRECQVYDRSSYHQLFGRYGITDSFLPVLSISLTREEYIKTILYTREVASFWEYNQFPNLDVCNSQMKYFLPIYINPINTYGIPFGERFKRKHIPYLSKSIYNRNLKVKKFNPDETDQTKYDYIAFSPSDSRAQLKLDRNFSHLKLYFYHQQKQDVIIQLVKVGQWKSIEPDHRTENSLFWGALERGKYQLQLLKLGEEGFSLISPLFFGSPRP